MEDCKCGRIPPCYGGRVFNIYEEAKKVKHEWDKTQELWGAVIDKMRAKLMEGGFFDDTYHKVYGVNEQLCDLGKTMNDPFEPLSKEATQEIAKALEITRKPKGIIMEKKLNPMTKAEAFEYLMHKKVACYNRKEVDIQKKLFEIGFKWCDGTTEEVVGMFDFLLIDDGTFQFTDNVSHFRKHAYEEIEMDDILSIEIVDGKKDDDERKGEILEEIAKLGGKISDLLEEYGGDVIVEIDLFDVILRNSGDILYRK